MMSNSNYQSPIQITIYWHGRPGMITIHPRDTFHDLRELLKEEWDDDMLPPADFEFFSKGKRISRKMEQKLKVADFRKHKISLHSTFKERESTRNDRKRRKIEIDLSTDVIDLLSESSDDSGSIGDKSEPTRPGNSSQTAIEIDLSEDETDSIEFSNVQYSERGHVKEKGISSPKLKSEENPSFQIQPLDCKARHQDVARAIETSTSVLKKLDLILKNNPLFCSPSRLVDWRREISSLLSKQYPKILIGVLGNTGVGKSSLLNALLDENDVLPTSGSRGCTAVAVELCFNEQLCKRDEDEDEGLKNIFVYKGIVEFVGLEEWNLELKSLIEDCCTEEGNFFKAAPNPENAPDAASAWDKISAVYGKKTITAYFGQSLVYVVDQLSKSDEVKKHLSVKEGSSFPYNTIIIKKGEVEKGSPDAKALISSSERLSLKLQKEKKIWAKDLGKAISTFVYGSGNEDEPQTWPLVRKVKLYGPWPVLMTGACFVDLPGTRDANVARARVSEQYIQHCNKVWVISPIQRAVSDKSAKELLGDQFKRQLLMDGQYSNVDFICTQTDDCEPTEIMKDHKNIACHQPGRWEQIEKINGKITMLEQKQVELAKREELLSSKIMRARKLQSRIRAMSNITEKELRKAENEVKMARRNWRRFKNKMNQGNREEIEELQMQLRNLCANVRNEYTAKCLKDDFMAGLANLYDEHEEQDGIKGNHIEFNSFCVSANDYLKLHGIKPKIDGGSKCFTNVKDTQIPKLRSFVHSITFSYRVAFGKNLVNCTSNLVGQMQLLASGADMACSKSVFGLKSTFDSEALVLTNAVKRILETFSSNAHTEVNSQLLPALEKGASEAEVKALATVQSWGSKTKRTRYESGPQKNGLAYRTYEATVRRDGLFYSKAVGKVDMNEELCVPCQKRYFSHWQSTMVQIMQELLMKCEKDFIEHTVGTVEAVQKAFAKFDVDENKLASVATTARQVCLTAIQSVFQTIRETASRRQRELNRSLLPIIIKHMKPSYNAAREVPRGLDAFNRMKEAMKTNVESEVSYMFNNSVKQIINEVYDMINALKSELSNLSRDVVTNMERVLMIYWDEHVENNTPFNAATKEMILKCRESILRELDDRLRPTQERIMPLVGINPEEPRLTFNAGDKSDQRKSTNKFYKSEQDLEDRKPPAKEIERNDSMATDQTESTNERGAFQQTSKTQATQKKEEEDISIEEGSSFDRNTSSTLIPIFKKELVDSRKWKNPISDKYYDEPSRSTSESSNTNPNNQSSETSAVTAH